LQIKVKGFIIKYKRGGCGKEAVVLLSIEKKANMDLLPSLK
jgi:hypothetical protein